MRIDNLTPGDVVNLTFTERGESTNELAVFVGLDGEGDARRATFRQASGSGSFEWDAYRYSGRWAYGSSADRLSLYSVVIPMTAAATAAHRAA